MVDGLDLQNAIARSWASLITVLWTFQTRHNVKFFASFLMSFTRPWREASPEFVALSMATTVVESDRMMVFDIRLRLAHLIPSWMAKSSTWMGECAALGEPPHPKMAPSHVDLATKPVAARFPFSTLHLPKYLLENSYCPYFPGALCIRRLSSLSPLLPPLLYASDLLLVPWLVR